MDAQPIAYVFTVRGRPVGYRPSYFGGELVATERGYFPVSSTGYRSLAGDLGFEHYVSAAAVPEGLLNSLATEADKERQATLVRVARKLPAGPDRLANFIGASMDAEKAINDGFFAPDADRASLWQSGYRRLCLIDGDPRFRPEPNDRVWTPEFCADAIEKVRTLLAFVQQLASGDFPAQPPPRAAVLHSYFDLPPKPAGEPATVLPAVTSELSLGPTEEYLRDDEEEMECFQRRAAGHFPDQGPDQGMQLRLF